MALRFAAIAILVWAIGLEGSAGFASPPPRKDSEPKLLARIERQQNPVRRAKLKVRLGRVKLTQAIAAYDRGSLEQCQQLLDSYLETMQSAWADLQSSGREAWRKPNGFKQLDIGLREDIRFLEDLMRRVPYEHRGPVEKVFHEAESLREAVLKALFPPVRPQKERKKFVGRASPQFARGASWG